MDSQSQETQLALIKNDVSWMRGEMKNMSDTLNSGYTPVQQFNTLKDRVDLIFRGFTFLLAIIVLAIFGAIFRLIFR